MKVNSQEIELKGKNLFDGGKWVMNDSISRVTIDNNNTVRISGAIASNYLMREGEEKKMNKFLEIKEGQEIDKIIDKFFDERKSIVMNDKIYKIILKAEQEIREIYKEEQVESDVILPEYITNENRLKIDKLEKERKEKEKKVKEKYAEVAALVEDMLPPDKIKIYERYEIL